MKPDMRQSWEQWRAEVLLGLVNSNITPEDALVIAADEDEWMKQAFADGEYASSIALDLLARC